MARSLSRVAADEPELLDEGVVIAVLERHFPDAAPDAIRRAAEDVLMLEMLMRDSGVVWEDAMTEPPDPVGSPTVWRTERRHRS